MNKRQRGSAMLLTIMLTVSTTSVVTAVAALSVQSAITEARVIQFRQARHAFEGAMAMAEHEFYQSPIALPAARNYKVGEAQCNVTLTDNSSSILRTVLATCTVTIADNKYRFAKVFGTREIPKPSHYALFINSSDWDTENFTTGSGGANGDVCVNASIPDATGTYTINGDLESAGTIAPAGITVTGERRVNMPVIPFPALDRTSYNKAATLRFSGNQTWNSGVSFAPGNPLIYIDGDLSIRGVIVGAGTIYVTGTISITNNLSYSLPGDAVVFIAENDIIARGAVTNLVGYYFTPKEFKTEGTPFKTLSPGGIVCDKIALSKPLTIIHDPRIWTDTTFGARYKIPSFWP